MWAEGIFYIISAVQNYYISVLLFQNPFGGVNLDKVKLIMPSLGGGVCDFMKWCIE